MPAVTLSDPAVLAFVVIPLGLLMALLWGTHVASRRLNEDDGHTPARDPDHRSWSPRFG